MNKYLIAAGAIVAGLMSQTALADMAVGLRAGTFGVGADVEMGLTDTLNVRVGYNAFSYSRTVTDTDITYDGKLKIGAASAIFDWHAFHGGFRFFARRRAKGTEGGCSRQACSQRHL